MIKTGISVAYILFYDACVQGKVAFWSDQPIGAIFAVRYQEIGSPDVSVGTITRARDTNDNLGYAYDYGVGKKGFHRDASTDNVAENNECYSFILSLILPHNGTTKVLISTHETKEACLFNGELSGIAWNWDAVVQKSFLDSLQDHISEVATNVMTTSGSTTRRKYLAAIEAQQNADGSIGIPMAGMFRPGQVSISEWLPLNALVGTDQDKPATDAQHRSALVALLARNQELPTRQEAAKQRQVELAQQEEAERQRRQQQEHQQEQKQKQKQQHKHQQKRGHPESSSQIVLKTPRVRKSVAKADAALVEVISDDDADDCSSQLSNDIDILIPSNERTVRKINKLSKEVVIKAARILRLDNGGVITGITVLRSSLKNYFAVQAEEDDSSLSFDRSDPGDFEGSDQLPAAVKCRTSFLPPPPVPRYVPPLWQRVQPSPWQENFDEQGRSFWYNPRTSVSTYDRPEAFTAPPPQPPPRPPPQVQPSPWQEHLDEQGRSFWYNPRTSVSTYDRPEALSAIQEKRCIQQDSHSKRARLHADHKFEPHRGLPRCGTAPQQVEKGASYDACYHPEACKARERAGAFEARERAEAREARERAEAREARERAEAREARERAEARETRERSRAGYC